jgi:ribosomal protein L37AE/L43A
MRKCKGLLYNQIMGRGFEVQCDNCGFKETFLLGAGMMDGNLQNHLELIRSNGTKRIKEYLDKPGYKIVAEFSRDLYECPNCDTLHFRYDYEIWGEDAPPLKPTFRCGSCRGKLGPATKEIEEYHCRKCQKGKLHIVGAMLWD